MTSIGPSSGTDTRGSRHARSRPPYGYKPRATGHGAGSTFQRPLRPSLDVTTSRPRSSTGAGGGVAGRRAALRSPGLPRTGTRPVLPRRPPTRPARWRTAVGTFGSSLAFGIPATAQVGVASSWSRPALKAVGPVLIWTSAEVDDKRARRRWVDGEPLRVRLGRGEQLLPRPKRRVLAHGADRKMLLRGDLRPGPWWATEGLVVPPAPVHATRS